MSATMTAFERLSLKRIAFGIRFQPQFGLEDTLGAVIDDVLALPGFGPERFETTFGTQDGRVLSSANNDQSISLTRADAIMELSAKDYGAADLSDLGKEFVDNVWAAVCRRSPRAPSIVRYGCLVGFSAPDSWNPIKAMLETDSADTSEFDLRFVRRLPAEGALAKQDVNDYRNAIFLVKTRKSKTTALFDFQHIFDPALTSDRARKEQPYERFVDKAVAYFRLNGFEFLKTRIERLSRAA